jgi:putative ATPase
MHVFEFKELTAQAVIKAVDRAFAFLAEKRGMPIDREAGVSEHIASACGGDVRKAINAAELLTTAAVERDGKLIVTMEDAKTVSQKSAMRYDRDGDSHYDIISALQKSIRGSDPDAGIHYLARLVEAGDLPITAGGFWSSRRRTWALPILRRSPL